MDIIESLKDQLLLFGRIMPKTFWASSPDVHYEVEEVLLDPTKRKCNLILPRGTAKTTLAGEVKPLHHIFVEDAGTPKFIVIVSKTQSHSKAQEQGFTIPGLQIKEMPKNSKSFRNESFEPLFAEGKVFLLENMTEFHDELVMYPRAKNDDTLDGFYYAQKKIYIPYHSANLNPLNDEDEFEWSETNWKLS